MADEVNVREALEKILDMLQVHAHGSHLKLDADAPVLPTKQVTALALIVHELVTNALKHSRGEVEVSFKVTDGPIRNATLCVSDDGDGFPDGFDVQNDIYGGYCVSYYAASPTGYFHPAFLYDSLSANLPANRRSRGIAMVASGNHHA